MIKGLSILFAVILILGFCYPEITSSGEISYSDEITVGIINLPLPEEYIVAQETKTKKKRLYKKEVFNKIENKGIIPLQSVILETIEYRYRPVSGDIEFTPSLFELVEIKDRKAILERDYIEDEEKYTDTEEKLKKDIEDKTIEETVIENEPQKKIISKRLVANLFYKIETKKLSSYEWEVKLPTLLDAAINFGNVLGLVIKKIDKLVDPEKRQKIFFSSSIGKGVLSVDGLLIKSLSSSLRSKCGLKNGDIVKLINGRPITNIHDVADIFSNFNPSSPSTITIRLVRKESELTFTYYIR